MTEDRMGTLEQLQAEIKKLEAELSALGFAPEETGEVVETPEAIPEVIILRTPKCPLGGKRVVVTYSMTDEIPESMKNAERVLGCISCGKDTELDSNGLCYQC
jgi:hypothetical protein